MNQSPICKKCRIGMTINARSKIKSREKTSEKEKRAKGVVKDKNIFATYRHKCKKCGYDKAEIIERGVFWSDENTDIILRCGKCGWSEHVNRKSM